MEGQSFQSFRQSFESFQSFTLQMSLQKSTTQEATPTVLKNESVPKPPLILDLFCGTKSIKPVAEELGFQYIGLDFHYSAEIFVDIHEWDYKASALRHPLVVWASPPCTEYSAYNRALKGKNPDIEGANKNVQKAIEIIAHFDPMYWFIENPQTGTLKDQDFMRDLPWKDVTYCMYGVQHRKRTRIWTNCGVWNARPLCQVPNQCEHKRKTGRHTQLHKISHDERIKVPADLVRELLSAVKLQ